MMKKLKGMVVVGRRDAPKMGRGVVGTSQLPHAGKAKWATS